MGIDANDLYRRVVQRATVGTLLGSTALGNQMVLTLNDFFMSRGHLTARADYVFSTQQGKFLVMTSLNHLMTHWLILGATFWFVNASPQVRHPNNSFKKVLTEKLYMKYFQWQTFNGGNWNSLENDVRSFVGRLNRDLIMYTGTWVGKLYYSA